MFLRYPEDSSRHLRPGFGIQRQGGHDSELVANIGHLQDADLFSSEREQVFKKRRLRGDPRQLQTGQSEPQQSRAGHPKISAVRANQTRPGQQSDRGAETHSRQAGAVSVESRRAKAAHRLLQLIADLCGVEFVYGECAAAVGHFARVAVLGRREKVAHTADDRVPRHAHCR